MKTYRILPVSILVFLLVMASTASGQAPDTLWSRTYLAGSVAHSLYELPDSGFVLGGYVAPSGEIYRDMYIIRTDEDGDTLWTRTIGSPDHEEATRCLYPTSDGGFVLVGSRVEDPPNSMYTDVYLVKTDHLGIPEWPALLGNAGESESGLLVRQSTDGGYLIVESKWHSTTGYDIWVHKATGLGTQQWAEHYTWPDADRPTAICLTRDGGFAITGYSQSFDSEYDYDMFILKLDELGQGVWSIARGASHPYDEAANAICHTSDGGYLMCGYRRDDATPKDIYVVKTDALGGFEWSSQLGGNYHDEAWSCIETIDGGYAVAASWHRDGNWKTALIKFDQHGDTLWTAFWGDPANGHTPYGLVQTADNGFAVGGLMSGGTMKAYLVKFAAEPVYEPYTLHAEALGLAIDDVTPLADTIMMDIDDDTLAGRHVVGTRVLIDALEHPALEGLSMSIAHDGVAATLVAEGDMVGANMTGTVFSDAASCVIAAGEAPYNGTVRSVDNLSLFNGMEPNGEWILMINDGAAGNSGTLQAWGIALTTDIPLDAGDWIEYEPISDYRLSQCYPNPFNPSTTIRYSLPRRAHVTIDVFNALGQRVKALVDESKPVGEHQVTWDGTDSHGRPVAAGVYFYRLRTENYIESRKMVLLK